MIIVKFLLLEGFYASCKAQLGK